MRVAADGAHGIHQFVPGELERFAVGVGGAQELGEGFRIGDGLQVRFTAAARARIRIMPP